MQLVGIILDMQFNKVNKVSYIFYRIGKDLTKFVDIVTFL